MQSLDPVALLQARPRGAADSPAQIRQAAQQFEALLIAQLMRAAQTSGSGGFMGPDEGEADSTMLELAQEQFAQALAAGGGLGMTDMIVQGLKSGGPAGRVAASVKD